MSPLEKPSSHYVFFPLLFCFFAIVFINGLNAQTYATFRSDLESIRQNSRWKLGPVWVDPALQFNLERDSSIYGTYGGRPAVADSIGTAGIPTRFHLTLREKLILSFTENPQYMRFFEHTGESSFNNSYSVGGRLRLLRPLVLSGSHVYNRAKYRVSSEIEQRIFEQVEENSGSLFLETPRGSALGIIGSSSRYKYEDQILPGSSSFASRNLNRKENNLRVEFYRPASINSAYFLNFGYTDYRFEYPQSRSRDSYSYQANAGIRLPLLGRARGLLSLGYKYFRPRDKQQGEFSGLVGNTSLEYRFSRFGLLFQLLRDVFFSYWTDSLYFVDSRLGAGFSFYLSRNIRLGYDVLAGKGAYAGVTVNMLPDGSIQQIRRKDTYLTHVGSLVFRIQRNTGIGLRGYFYQRDSNDYYYANQDRWIAGVFLTYDF